MDKQTIANLLESKHKQLINYYKNQDEDSWQFGPEGKWTSGQHALHLLQSIRPLNKALSLPKLVLKLKFGKSNRPTRDYNTIKSKYLEKLKTVKGKTYKPSRNMRIPSNEDKPYILNCLEIQNKKLQHKIMRWKDKDLDDYILPHPLMGKMTVRELVMWTAFHIEQHTNTLQVNY